MRILFGFGIFLLAIGYALRIGAQELSPSQQLGSRTRTVSGSVVLQGNMVTNIRVTLQSPTRSFQRTAFTDGSGSFAFAGVPVGEYTIELEAEGYLTQRESLDIPPGSGVFPVQFLMRPASTRIPLTSKEKSVSVATLHVSQDARAEYAAGLREVERKRWKEARQHFEKALQKHADFPQALRALALLDLLAQQSDRALERLRRAVQIDASYADAQLTLSQLLNRQGKAMEALEVAQKAVALQPEMWEAQYELGMAALALGQEQKALEASQRIDAKAGPKVGEGKLLRAGVHLRRLQYSEAKAELTAFLSLAPNHQLAPLAKKTLAEIEGKVITVAPH